MLEASVACRAYGTSPDWAASLYEQFVDRGDQAYLEAFLSNVPLTPDLVLNVVKK